MVFGLEFFGLASFAGKLSKLSKLSKLDMSSPSVWDLCFGMFGLEIWPGNFGLDTLAWDL